MEHNHRSFSQGVHRLETEKQNTKYEIGGQTNWIVVARDSSSLTFMRRKEKRNRVLKI